MVKHLEVLQKSAKEAGQGSFTMQFCHAKLLMQCFSRLPGKQGMTNPRGPKYRKTCLVYNFFPRDKGWEGLGSKSKWRIDESQKWGKRLSMKNINNDEYS
eukprot:4485421-Amphidinium_carterae.1